MEITGRVITRGLGGGEGGKVQRINSINDRRKIDRGRVRIVIGNVEAKEFICVTHGHKL